MCVCIGNRMSACEKEIYCVQKIACFSMRDGMFVREGEKERV